MSEGPETPTTPPLAEGAPSPLAEGPAVAQGPPVETAPSPVPEPPPSLSASSEVRPLEPELYDEGPVQINDLRAAWPYLYPDERLETVRMLPTEEAEAFFCALPAIDQAPFLLLFPAPERRSFLALLQPDDIADVIQAAPPEERERLLLLLNEQTRHEVRGLLAYAEDHAGGLMHTRYARLRPEATVEESISYLRRQTREKVELLYYAYVLDASQRLLGVVSLRELLTAPSRSKVSQVMQTEFVTVRENLDQEAVSQVFKEHDLIAIPVVDDAHHMKGIVTIDDVVDVVTEEATEDAHKFGGLEALDAPYLSVGIGHMLRRRGVWLAILFMGEMLTLSAMARFQDHLTKAVVLAIFIPLIISSGGNSGSQASTLVIRAMALDEVRLRDWWRVFRREVGTGLALGALLAAFGLSRVFLGWQFSFEEYGAQWLLVGITVAISLVGVVTFGTLAGSTLPFALRRLGFDPASASAPLVATLVDVTGLLIYFGVASVVLRGTLL